MLGENLSFGERALQSDTLLAYNAELALDGGELTEKDIRVNIF